MAPILALGLAALCLPLVAAQGTPPSSWPHDYPNKPTTPYGPTWQSYFRVTQPLPGVSFPLSRSYAGNLPVQRAGHDNDTLFFWGFEKSTGSLTAPASPLNKQPWTIFLNGGPGSSSLYGLFFENGPIRIKGDGALAPNQHSWDKLSDIFWIDQPVGVGFSTADSDGYVADNNQLGRDFIGFLDNLVKVFPSLKTRPLYITGESYAGMYIPYILKTYFATPNPPVKIEKIMIGDGTITSGVVFNLLPALSLVETFPQLIGYDPEVYLYIKEQSTLCGYDVTLTYPQNGIMPDIPLQQPRDREIPWLAASQTFNSKLGLFSTLQKRFEESEVQGLQKRDREAGKENYKRSLADRVHGQIDPWYGCFLFDLALDYAINFTYPWNQNDGDFNVYDVVDATSPQPAHNANPFMNNAQTRAALHAPTSKQFAQQFSFPYGPLGRNDPSPYPINFLTEIATNATANNVGIVLVAGNNDGLIPHLGSEIAIQNTTFGGIQGFTRKPATPWTDDNGKFAGIVHQERGWVYALFYGTGHMIPAGVPKAAYKFFRDFVLGNDPLGKVIATPSGGSMVIGGTHPQLEGKNLPGSPEIFVGAGTTQSTYTYPKATRSAWDAFIRTETATTTPTPASTPTRRHRALRNEE